MNEAVSVLTESNLIITLLVLCALLLIYNLVCAARKNYRELKKPTDEREKNIAAKLAKHDSDIAALKEGLKVNCTGVKALLNHELHNGNSQEMQAAATAMDTWLINK